MANADFEDRVRARLRQARFERGLTLARLAAAAGLATSTVSRLETGARGLSLAHVDRLAAALGLAPEALVGAAPAAPAPAADGRGWEPLGDERTTGRRAYRVTVPAAAGPPQLHGHEGHQWLYVLGGALRLVTPDADLVLARGQAAELSTWTPHWLAGPADLLVLFDPDGAPLPVRAVGS